MRWARSSPRRVMSVEEGCAEVTVATSSVSPKVEEPLLNVDSDGSATPGRSSPDPGCPICLGRLENKSFTDSCLHQFCFRCLLEWSKVKAECPLCKQSFKSIIHTVRSIEDYKQHYLTTSAEGTVFVSREIFARLESTQPPYPTNFRFRSTAISSYLDYYVRLEEAISHRAMVIPPGPSVSGGTLWQRRRQRGTSDFRRNIYQQGLWAQRHPFYVGARQRECSPQFYRDNPAQVHRLVPWLNRELNVLLYENSPHIQHVMSRILELVTQVPIRSAGFADVIAPYIGRHTEHFVHEFYSFAVSPYDLVGYDRHATYVSRDEAGAHEEALEDSDSDVQVLEDGAGVRQPSPLIQLVDTDSDDCIVLDVPARAEPEVITLDSDDDVVQINVQSSSSCRPRVFVNHTQDFQPSSSSRPRIIVNHTQDFQPSSSSRPPRVFVNHTQVPTTSVAGNVDGCEISIILASAPTSRSASPSPSEASSASWVPVRTKPTKVEKKRMETKRERTRKRYKGKASQTAVKKKVPSDIESESSSSPVARRRKPPSAALVVSSSESDSNKKPPSSSGDSNRERTVNRKSAGPVRNRNPSLSSISSGSDRLCVATDSSTSEDEFEYKPRLRSVVVKREPRAISPSYFSGHSRSSRDYDSYSPWRYDQPGSSRSKCDKSRSDRRHSTSSSAESLPNKQCKHFRKRFKNENKL